MEYASNNPELDALGQPLHPPTDESGNVDLSIIESNLALTPAERIRRHNDFLELVLALRRAGEKLRESENSSVAR
jgi:hypothetical protein